MAHECPECGMECYCDGEDHHQEAPDDCSHECDECSEPQAPVRGGGCVTRTSVPAKIYRGRVCKKCLGTLRYRVSMRCVKCAKAESKAVYRFDSGPSRKASADWHKTNAEAHNELMRAGQLKRKFGLTVAGYDTLLACQNAACAICKQTCPTGRRLAVDHDHKTNAVRGLLCHNCNLGIGKLGDDPQRILAAAKYLLDKLDKPTSTSVDTAQSTQDVGTTYSVKLLS